jgi:hypothetical protein
MASVGIEPQLVHDTACCHYHYTTRSLLEDSRNLFTSFFSLACIINIRHIPSHKTASVGLEPQCYMTQPVAFTTRPLARCWQTSATY